MKRFGMMVLVAVSLATMATASVVSRDEASYAARRWAASGAVPGGPLGQKVVSSETLVATNDVLLHAVRLDGGTAFVSADTELEPIVAFTTMTNFTASADNPLWRLLKRDAIVRAAALRYSKSANLRATASAGFVSQMKTSTSAASGKWAALLEGRSAQQDPKSFGATETPPNKLDGVSDVRCAPLLKSQWSQTQAQKKDCYNIYTPDNDPCGCTATAMSQIMRYHEFPKDSVAAKTYPCAVDGEAKNLTMQGGTYEWSKMTLCPASSTYVAENWEAIGKLTSDAGIALQSSYTSGAGSSYVSLVGKALKEAFGYANAAAIFNWDIAEEAYSGDGTVKSEVGLHSLAVREKVIYANLDAKCPVELGVYGYGDNKIGEKKYWEGHAIVGDGYGYSEYGGEQVPYVHINLGWHGLDDAWYNVPEIHSPNSGSYAGSAGTAFTVLSAAAYNLFPTNTGNIVAGRVYDEEGTPIAGAKVTIRGTGSKIVLGTRTTDAKGIYAFIIPGGKDYEITCDDLASGLTDTHTVHVPKETLEVDDKYGVYTETDENVGNYWGHDADFEMSQPCVRIARAPAVLYMSLDQALAAAQDGDTLEIFASAPLRRSATLTNSYMIVSTNAVPAEAPVRRVDGAALTVATGATLTLSNVAFVADAAQPVVSVETNATLKIAGILDLGTVRTADAAGLDLCGTLVPSGEGVLVDCLKGRGKGDVFGTFSCDYPTASAAANLIYNVRDEDLGGIADSATGKLKWGVVTVPVEYAKVVVDDGSDLSGYRTFAAALKVALDRDAVVTVKRDVTHTNTVTLSHNLTLTSTNNAVLSFGVNAGFVIPTDMSMTLTNAVVSGVSKELKDQLKDCAFKVTGGELTLEDGATVMNLKDNKTGNNGGCVVVNSGSVTMKSGSRIENCEAHAGANGGAIWLGSGTARANLLGGTIEGCHAACGGAVYAWGNKLGGASVNVAEDFTAILNTSTANSSGVGDNLYLMRNAGFTLTDALTGLVGVSFGKIKDVADLNATNAAFVAVGSDVTPVEAATSAPYFVNDNVELGLIGSYDADAGQIVWAPAPPDDGQCDPSEANVVVTVPGESDPRYYLTLDRAFEYTASLETNDLVYAVRNNDVLSADAAIMKRITLTTAAGYPVPTVWRESNAMYNVCTNASLTITNIMLSGYSGIDPDGGHKNNSTVGLISVKSGGKLVLAAGSTVFGVLGSASAAANAISVEKAGTLTMEPLSRIYGCTNTFVDVSGNSGYGGAIRLVAATAYLRGGTVEDCAAAHGGGVGVMSKSKVYVSGGFTATQNTDLAGNANNFLVTKYDSQYLDSTLVMVDEFTGAVGYSEGISAQTNVFGRVVSQKSPTDFVASAARFFRDDNSTVTGRVATNATETLLVWSTALKTDPETGREYYEDESGYRYYAVGEPPAPPPGPVYADPTPIAFKSITRVSEAEWGLVVTDRVQWAEYRLIWTDDLTKGFTTTGGWEQATLNGAWTTNVLFAAPPPAAIFWKAEGQRGQKPVD